jgi:hypothetical protein
MAVLWIMYMLAGLRLTRLSPEEQAIAWPVYIGAGVVIFVISRLLRR